MEFVFYDTCDRLLWISGEGSRIKIKISKEVIPKTHTNKIYTPITLSFGCSPHKDNCDILSEDLFFSIFQVYY